MSVQVQTKTVVSVAEMARMVSMSRARFYQLVEQGIFPPPLYRIDTKRPFFTQEMQESCLEVRRRNCGINGRPVLFYARRLETPISKAMATPPKNSHKHAELIEGLRALGFGQFRVRSHGDCARVEVAPEAIEAAWKKRHEVGDICKKAGFIFGAIDVDGYRTGAMNEALPRS